MGTAKDRGKLRAFIAIQLPDTIRELLKQRIDYLKAELAMPMRWVAPQSSHLTLKFLGDIPEEQVPHIVGALERASIGSAPLTLKIGRLGCFPNPRRARVLWVGIEGETEALIALQARIEDAIHALGFGREDRPFAPHLTLARTKGTGSNLMGKKSLEELLAGRTEDDQVFIARGLSLMKSTLTPRGSVYTRLAFVPLGDNGKEKGSADP